MPEERNYIEILNKARRKRKKPPYVLYAGLAAVGVAVAVLAIVSVKRFGGEFSVKEAEKAQEPRAAVAAEVVISPEEEAAQKLMSEKQAVVDTYENLGLVQIDFGYVNIRETPEESGTVIGQIPENGACEILGTEGDWYHVTSGEAEGYVKSENVVTGDAAREKALEFVEKRATVHVESDVLLVRETPSINSENRFDNVIDNIANGESYVVEEELDGWVKIRKGYVSADFVTIAYGLPGGRKLDARTMAVNRYNDLLISKVNDYLNVRSEPENKGFENVIGKLPSNAAGEILETLDGWYKIKSGSITGYVSADYVAVGQEAKDIAAREAELMAIVNVDGLRVRAEPSTDAKIWTLISKEERYPVIEQLDGWVEIELDTGDGEDTDKSYISTREDNVEVRYMLQEAIKFSPLEEAANKQAALRNKVVNYGLQFVGGRYVWGGTNPNTGADCSGFVQYVMRNAAGVSLPRTSREQAKVGRAVKSNEMVPGDLIFYTNKSGTVNHVAMYIGNGQIVHAASRRSGIRISTWNYRTPKYIRRVLN